MPVSGILNSNMNRIKFQLLSVQAIFSIILFCFGSIDLVCRLAAISRSNNNTLGHICNIKIALFQLFCLFNIQLFTVFIILEVICLSYMIIFFKLAREWPKIIKKWRQIEDKFLQRPYGKYKGYSLVRKIHTVGFIMILLSIC